MTTIILPASHVGWGRTLAESEADLLLSIDDHDAWLKKHAYDGEIAERQMDQWRRDNLPASMLGEIARKERNRKDHDRAGIYIMLFLIYFVAAMSLALLLP